jgi:hypothetical protein
MADNDWFEDMQAGLIDLKVKLFRMTMEHDLAELSKPDAKIIPLRRPDRS